MRTGRILVCPLLVLPTVLVGQTRTKALDDNLAILEPKVGKTWVGRIKSLDSDEYYDITGRLDVLRDGKAIKISGGCEALDNLREGFIYWDAGEEQIALFLINNKGTFQRGRVALEEGKIVVSGTIVFPGRALEFRNVFEMTPGGTLIDRWFRKERGEWLAGRSLELVAEE